MFNIEVNHMTLRVTRPNEATFEQVASFLETVVRDTFEKNALSDLVTLIEEEILEKRHKLRLDLDSDGKNEYFLVAWLGDRVVATIGICDTGHLILSCTHEALAGVKEIGSVFVHPELQGQGIGSEMFKLALQVLKAGGETHYCLDSGYKTAQRMWQRKLGEPTYCLKDFWGEGGDHMIWHRAVVID